jgi:hypothetical protein
MGVISHSEHLSQGRKDVLIYHQGLAIVLEGSYNKKDAEDDAKKRIEQLAADVAIAIHYPPADFPQELTASAADSNRVLYLCSDSFKASSVSLRSVMSVTAKRNLPAPALMLSS